jgi:hypothetical protein
MPRAVAVTLSTMHAPSWFSRLNAGSRREREWRWFRLLAGFGLLGLPLCVFIAGRVTLGAYEGSGLFSFLGTFYLDLLKLKFTAWGLLLGPWLLFQTVRYASRPARRLSGRLPHGRAGSGRRR